MSGVDYLGRQSLNSIFGDNIVAQRVADITAQFQYGSAVSSYDGSTDVTGTGSAAITEQCLELDTGASTGTARFETYKPLRYIPGYDGYAKWTFWGDNFDSEGAYVEGGLNDDNGGFKWRITADGPQFGYIQEGQFITSNTTLSNESLHVDWSSGLHILRLTYAFLGIGPIILERQSGLEDQFVPVATINIVGNSNRPHTSQPTQKVTLKAGRTSGSGSVKVRCASISAGHIGPLVVGAADRPFAIATSKASIPTTETNIITLQNKTTYGGTNNKVGIKLKYVSFANEVSSGKTPVEFFIRKNITLGGTPSYTDKDTTNSVVEYDVAGTTITGDGLEFGAPIAADGSDKFFVGDLNIVAYPGETLTISGKAGAGTMTGSVIVRWDELF